MVKNTPSLHNEMGLIDLINAFFTHKTKYIILGIIGLILGLVYTFLHEPRIETQFKIRIGHPIFNNEFIFQSSSLHHLLDSSALNQTILPQYKFNERTHLFSVTDSTEPLPEFVTKVFSDALRQDLLHLKQIAANYEGFDDKTNYKNLYYDKNNYNNFISWTNKDIAKLNIEQVVQSIKISFRDPISHYPNPFKHGVIGLVIGLVLAFGWMMTLIATRELQRQKK